MHLYKSFSKHFSSPAVNQCLTLNHSQIKLRAVTSLFISAKFTSPKCTFELCLSPFYRGVDHCQVSEQHLVTSASSHFIAAVLRSDERGTLQTPHSRILGIAARTGDAVIEHVALVKQSRRTGIELPTTSPITIRSTSGVGGPSGAFVFSLIIALHDQNNIWNVIYVPCTFVLQRTSLWHANNSLKTSVASVWFPCNYHKQIWMLIWLQTNYKLVACSNFLIMKKKMHLPDDFFQGFVEE